MVFAEFQRIFKEIYWLQFLFLSGNYSVVCRNLRHDLEMMAQAYFIDRELPCLSIDAKMDQMIEMENDKDERKFGWAVVKPVLRDVLNCSEEYSDRTFQSTWAYLNKHVHASAERTNLVADEDPASFVMDSFNSELAKVTLIVTDKVMDLVFAIVFTTFPRIKRLGVEHKIPEMWAEYSPNTIAIVEAG